MNIINKIKSLKGINKEDYEHEIKELQLYIDNLRDQNEALEKELRELDKINTDLKVAYKVLEKRYEQEVYEFNRLLKDANSFSRQFVDKMYHIANKTDLPTEV